MGKDDSLIMIVRKQDLFQGNLFQGFSAHHVQDYESRILQNYGFMTRKFAEDDPNYKQPIAYSMIVNPNTEQVFAFQRSQQYKNYPEKRLQGKWSWGVGGHIEKTDSKNANPIKDSMSREINEEVKIYGKFDPFVLGYINDDSNKVGEVHFGILYLIETDARKIQPKDPEIAEGRLRTIDELEKICASEEFKVESWSRIALNPLRHYLKNL